MGSIVAGLRRLRHVGVGLVVRKIAIRLWSTRVAVMVAAEIAPTDDPTDRLPPNIPLDFEIVPSAAVDGRELGVETARGAELLYLEGLLRMYGFSPGDAMVARTQGGDLVAVALLSPSDRSAALELAAPGYYPPITADECWTEAHYVIPAYRNRRVMTTVLAEERNYLRGCGIRRAIAVIESTNQASLRAFARAGYEPTGLVRLDRYRLNRYSGRFTALDDETRDRLQRLINSVPT